MKSALNKLLPALFCLLLVARLQAAEEPKLSPLPAPVSNNAVAISHDEGGPKIFSFMGIGPKKTWDAITTSAYEMDPGTGKWTEMRPVPGVAGRLAGSAGGRPPTGLSFREARSRTPPRGSAAVET